MITKQELMQKISEALPDEINEAAPRKFREVWGMVSLMTEAEARASLAWIVTQTCNSMPALTPVQVLGLASQGSKEMTRFKPEIVK